MIGIVTAVDNDSQANLKSVLVAPDSGPLITKPLLQLSEWISRYYGGSAGLALRAMLPGGLWGKSKLVASIRNPLLAPGGASADVVRALESRGGTATASALGKVMRRPVWETLQRLARVGAIELETVPPNVGPAAGSESVVVLVKHLPSLLEREKTFGRANRQREAYELIDELGGEISRSRLTNEFRFSATLVKSLVTRGLVEVQRREHLRDPFAGISAKPPGNPTRDQQSAIDDIGDLPGGKAATLFGVTGSGKTLVYLEVMRHAIASGKTAIVLVPEIALTPQTIARVRGVFEDRVAVLHSGLSDAERADAWRALAKGERQVVVGARSAVFAPVPNLSVIVVDEEHDGSYKNGEVPRYHARDVALRRATLESARVIFGSATPSLDVWQAQPAIRVIRLPHRVTSHSLPSVQLVDMRGAPRVETAGAVPWSRRLDESMTTCLARDEQIILLLNRRGFAHFLQCSECGDVPHCTECSIALTVHHTPPSIRCHYCGLERSIPDRCGACGGKTQRTRGVGTQALERWLAMRFPEARIARMDADTTATKWSHARILEDFAAAKIDVLLGTQMIAKGLDFPGVTLVGVVNADTGLHLPDFRAAERTFQLIAQVAGRAGRGPRGGEVLVQTRSPDHYALQYAVKHDYEGFAARELAERSDPRYPPHVGLINVLVTGETEAMVSQAAADVADWMRGLVTAQELPLDVLGPAPAPLARIKARWRWHILLRAIDRRVLGRVLQYAAKRAPHVSRGKVRVVFDRDPVSLL